jgi:hypothetical protein
MWSFLRQDREGITEVRLRIELVQLLRLVGSVAFGILRTYPDRYLLSPSPAEKIFLGWLELESFRDPSMPVRVEIASSLGSRKAVETIMA